MRLVKSKNVTEEANISVGVMGMDAPQYKEKSI